MSKFFPRISKILRKYQYLLFLLLILISLFLTITPKIAKSQTRPNQALEIVQKGQQLYQVGEYAQAVLIWRQAISLFPANSLNQAMVLSNLSLTQQQLGNWVEAQQALDKSRKILESLESTTETDRIFVQTLDIQGRLYYKTGKTQQALEIWQKAAKLYANPEDQKLNQINQSLALQDLGFYPRACQTLLAVLDLPSQECQISLLESDSFNLPQSPFLKPAAQAKALRQLGNIFRIRGDLSDAERILQTSKKIAEDNNLNSEVSKTLIYLGDLQKARAFRAQEIKEDFKELQQAAQRSYQQAAKKANSINRLQAQLKQLELVNELEDWATAENLIASLEIPIDALIESRENLNLQINYTKNFLCSKQQDPTCLNPNSVNLNRVKPRDLQKSLTRIEQTSVKASNLGDMRTYSYILGMLGRIYEGGQIWEQATKYTKAALYTSWQAQAPELSYQWQWQEGRILKAQGKNEAALSSYQETIKTLDSLRNELVSLNREVQFTFRESIEPIYRDYVDLLLRPGKNITNEDLQLARSTIDSLHLAELENFFRRICLDANPVVIDQITDQDDPTAAIIYPILLRDRLEIILKLPKQDLLHYTSPIEDSRIVEAFVNELAESLDQPNNTRAVLPLAQQVYDWIIRPIEAKLTQNQIKTLVFVLDSALRNIPMSVLNNGEKYLIENYSIALIPSLQLIDPQPLRELESRALLGGLSEARDIFPDLPNVPNELTKIQEKIPENSLLLNEIFTNTNLRDRLKQIPFSIVHLATHGQFSSQSEETFILTWNDRLNVNDLNDLFSGRNDNLGNIELLVLSACETITGDKRAALGLAGVAIRAGARSTLASLWFINDEATAIFMDEFYRYLSDEKLSKASALQKAQLSLLKNPNYESPSFWAPYVLLGNWL